VFMARRTFDVIDVVEILQHWHAGRSKADVAASVGVDRGTVRKYVATSLCSAPPPLTGAATSDSAEGVSAFLLGPVDGQLRSH
jgi:hypothetical protein